MSEYKAMHEEKFLSSWLREDERGKAERMAKAEKNEEESGERRKGEEEKEENETVTVRRRCEGFVSVDASQIFGQGRDLESCGDLSWEDPLEKFENWSDSELDARARVRMVLDVTDVLVFPSSVVTGLCDVSSCYSDWEFVEPPSFSFSKKAGLDSYAGRDEVRRFTCERAPAFKKKNDAAHATAKFVFII